MRASLLALLAGCSLSRLDTVECTENLQCREAFGWGYTCDTEAGLCAEAEIEPRCDETWPRDLFSNREAYQDVILLGALMNRTTADAEMLAFELPVRLVNEDGGGLDGLPFALIECDVEGTDEGDGKFDDRTVDEANVDMAVWLADSVGVPAILGPQYSSTSILVYDAVAPYGTLLMSHSATSDALTDIDGGNPTDQDPGLFWRTAPPDSFQGVAIAQDMADRAVADVAVIYQSGAYGDGLQQVFAEEFSALGGTASDHPFANDSQLTTAITDVASSDVDAVLFIASDQASVELFLTSISSSALIDDFADLDLFLTDGAYYQSVFENTRSTAESLFPNIRGSRPYVPTESNTYKFFSARFETIYEENPALYGYTAYAYDAAWLLIYGAAWATYQEGALTGETMARGLRQVSEEDEVEIVTNSWTTVKARFESGEPVDVIGASGDLDYDAATGETSAPIEIWTVDCSGSECEFVQADVIYP